MKSSAERSAKNAKRDNTGEVHAQSKGKLVLDVYEPLKKGHMASRVFQEVRLKQRVLDRLLEFYWLEDVGVLQETGGWGEFEVSQFFVVRIEGLVDLGCGAAGKALNRDGSGPAGP